MMPAVRTLQVSLSLGFVIFLGLACDEVTPQSYLELVEGSRECAAHADCVLAGEGECTCASPVKTSAQEEVIQAAADLDCEGVTTTQCPTHGNLRCEASRCITDDSP